jgi:hypothetical protein
VDGIDVIEFDLDYANAHGFTKQTMAFLKFAFASTKITLTSSYDVGFATTTTLTAGILRIFARWMRQKHFVFEARNHL